MTTQSGAARSLPHRSVILRLLLSLWLAVSLTTMCAGAFAAVAIPGMPAARTSLAATHAAPSASASDSITLTPEQAKHALDVLNDPQRRAQIEDTLRAVAAAGALSVTPPSPASASAAAAASAPPASGAAATLHSALTSNGLVSQLVRHGAQALHSVGGDLRRSVATLLNLSSVRSWWTVQLANPQERALLLHVMMVVLGTLIPALGIEWLAWRSLRRPRAAVAARGMAGEPDDEAHADANGDADASKAAVTPATATPTDTATPAAVVAPVSPETAATSNAASTPPATDTHSTFASTIANHLSWNTSMHHWTLLRRLPTALLYTLLEIVPLVAFVVVAGLLASLLTDDGTPEDRVLGSLIDVYVFCRGVTIASAFFIAPRAPLLRLVRMRDRWANFLQRWVIAIVCISGAGAAIANAAEPIGLSDAAHLAILKAVTFIGHLLIAIMILQCRRPVAARLRVRSEKGGVIALLGNWIADVWAAVAVFVVMALWFVWALDVRNGYRTLLHLGGVSLLILVCARVVAIVAFGALGRVFQQDEKTPPSIVRQRAARYYPMLRRTVSVLVAIVTLIALLEVWGVNIVQTFESGAVGHRLVSAVVTIVIAAAVALFVWESVNAAAERRLDTWTTTGDYVRAARLRTLLPMLRTALFVVIALVVVLTGLSELGVNTAPLLAGASIFGVALGFGSQKLVQDFITGIFLLMENAMQVGDSVTLAGVSGTVEYLSIRTVRLRGGDGSLFTVPFSSVSTVNNTNRGIGNAAVKVVIAYGQDVDLAVQTLKDIGTSLREDQQYRDGILSDFSYWGVDQVDGSAVTLVGQIQCKDTARWGVQREFNRRVAAYFTQRGIVLMNPQRNNVLLQNAGALSGGADDGDESTERDGRDRDDGHDDAEARATSNEGKRRDGDNVPPPQRRN